MTTLVLAGTGKTGGRLVPRLIERGVDVRVGSRRASPPFDWTDRTTWEPALRSVDAIYLAYYPDAGFPGAAEAVGAFTDLAVQQGVRRIVLLADRGAREAQRCEEVVRDSGTEWTVLRAGFITQNFSEEFLAAAVRSGVVALPAGSVTEPFLDARDIADVAAIALTTEGHAGATYDLTGPDLLTFADAIAEIATAVDRELRYVPVPAAQFASTLTERGAPAEYAQPLAALLEEVFDGRRSVRTDHVARVLSRAPWNFGDYVRETAPTGVWDPE
jgi:uncharacterized protein YbjT (DUF2867 family)